MKLFKSTSQLTVVYSLICLALLPIVLISGYFVLKMRSNVVSEKVAKLHAVAKSKQGTLENHLDSYIKSLTALSQEQSISNFLTEKIDFELANQSVRSLQEEHWGAFHHVFVADVDGKIVISPHHGKNTKSTHLHHSIADSSYFKKALESSQVSDFFGFEESTHYHPLAFVPIKHKNKTIGVIVSEITTKYLIDLLGKGFDIGQTGKIFLSTLDFKKVVHLKKEKISSMSYPLMKDANSRGESFGIDRNANDVEVLGSYLKSSKYPWILGIEIDKQEVLQPINKLTIFLAMSYLIAIIAFLFLVKLIVRLLRKPILEVNHIISNVSQASLSNSTDMKNSSDSLLSDATILTEALVESQDQLEQVVCGIRKDKDEITTSLRESTNSNETATQGRKIVEQMTSNIKTVDETTEKVKKESEAVSENILRVAESMREIQEKTSSINDIVFQTKLLSFNASVEAARAGESGKGFAVVAEEVGNLANMSGIISAEIQTIVEKNIANVGAVAETSREGLANVVKTSSNAVRDAGTAAGQCLQVFEKISENVNSVHKKIELIAHQSAEKVSSIQEVNDRFIHLKDVSQNASNVARQVSEATANLRKNSEDLSQVAEELNKKFAA